MNREELEQRLTDFVIRVLRMTKALPKDSAAEVIAKQLIRAATSVGANYREASRASSRRHFVTTLEIAQREACETEYWLELISRLELVKPSRLTDLQRECSEIAKILSASARTAKRAEPDTKSEMRDAK